MLVAAPASGQGKTTVTAALARLLARRGWRVRVFKCGPDFLDPFWHERASGHAVDTLDLWITGEADVRARLHNAARQADVILVEGVMGLHDGTPSAADLARQLGLPVLAVVQAAAMAQTFGAVAHGLRHYRAAAHGPLPWAGVLANHVGSPGHAALLQAALDSPSDWLGHLPRSPAMQLPERHLGLVAAHELGDAALARLDAAADALADTPLARLSLDDWRSRWSVAFSLPGGAADAANGDAFGTAVAGTATGAAALLNRPVGNAMAGAASPTRPLQSRTIAVARDAAFAFIYPANLALLRQLGAQVVTFSPLAADPLPDCDALWLPGGYPELHAATLAAHTRLRAQLHAHAAAGRPIWAECGGLMALADTLIDKTGTAHPLWGLLPGTVRMGQRLAALGPMQWAVGHGRPALRGHTFHHSTFHTPLQAIAHTQPAPGSAHAHRQGEAIYQHGSVRASYFHPWFASSPEAVAWLFGAPR